MRTVLRRAFVSLLIALVAASPATAGTIVVKLAFVPGKLSAKAAPVTPAAGRTVQVPVTVADGRGNGKGWTLRASAPVTVLAITARCASNSTCTLPAAVGTPAGNIVLRAAAGTGMGVMNLVVTLARPHAANLDLSVN
jgi:hypothetical protein